jgi:hypothetical protein
MVIGGVPEIKTGNRFEPLKNKTQFEKFYVHPELKTLVWPSSAGFTLKFLDQKLRPDDALLKKKKQMRRNVFRKLPSSFISERSRNYLALPVS